MPYVSEAQRRYFNYNKDKLQKLGVDVNEWNKATEGKKLPERVGKKKSLHQKVARGLKKSFPNRY